MGLQKYKEKRDFTKSDEPQSGLPKNSNKLEFVVQKHQASRLHYDFRLEMDGVLKSWAVPKGPSLNPKNKRLAMMVEDHPFDYRNFEGTIPKGEYGGGTVMVWDHGYYEPIETIKGKKAQEKHLLNQLKSGSLKIILHGEKLKGEFALVKTKGMAENAWLLLKHNDEFASIKEVTAQEKSVLSGKSLKALSLPGLSDKKTTPGRKMKIQKPMLATLADQPFDDSDWQFEVKWDGYRTLAQLHNGKVDLFSRNLKSFNKQFYPIYNALKLWKINAVLDGEIVVLNNKGISSFSELQSWETEADGELVFNVFDLIWLDGNDLTGLSLLQRQNLLKEIMPRHDPQIRLAEVFDTKGTEFYAAAARLGLEGMIAKRKSSRYTPDYRSSDWLKIKINKTQEVILIGYTKNKNSPKLFSGLLCAIPKNGELVYAGKVGTGFSEEDQKELIKKMKSYQVNRCPLSTIPEADKTSRFKPQGLVAHIQWLKPVLVAEIMYAEITPDGLFRHASFKGLRIDKSPFEIQPEVPESVQNIMDTPPSKPAILSVQQVQTLSGDSKADTQIRKVNGHQLKFTHLSKLYWPEEGITKRMLFDYYDGVAEYILPYLKDRPLSLNRFPGGIHAKSFYQKDVKGKAPVWAKTFPYTIDEEEKEYLVGNDKATLLWMVSLGCIELNPWFSRVQNPDYPDYCVIDLDPDQQDFNQVVEVALAINEILDQLAVPAYPKTSGSTGIHIYIPLGAKYTYEQSQLFARIIVGMIHQKIPEYTTLERTIAARAGKMYLDFLQNRPAATIACPYSLRPKPGATVSMPLGWEELKAGLKMNDFTIFNALKRIESKGDLFKGVLGKGIDLERALKRAKKIDQNFKS